jgi:hypothetical protein
MKRDDEYVLATGDTGARKEEKKVPAILYSVNHSFISNILTNDRTIHKLPKPLPNSLTLKMMTARFAKCWKTHNILRSLAPKAKATH